MSTKEHKPFYYIFSILGRLDPLLEYHEVEERWKRVYTIGYRDSVGKFIAIEKHENKDFALKRVDFLNSR